MAEPKLKDLSYRPSPPPPECSVTVAGRPAKWIPGQGEKCQVRTGPGSRTRLSGERATIFHTQGFHCLENPLKNVTSSCYTQVPGIKWADSTCCEWWGRDNGREERHAQEPDSSLRRKARYWLRPAGSTIINHIKSWQQRSLRAQGLMVEFVPRNDLGAAL